MRQRLQELSQQSCELNAHIKMLQQHRETLKRDDNYSRFAYVTQEDLEHLNNMHTPDYSSSSNDGEGEIDEEDMDEG